MNYYIFRIQPGFSSVMNEQLLTSIFEKEEDDFFHEQLHEIIQDIPWTHLLECAKEYFKDRADVHINPFHIEFQSSFHPLADELIALPHCLELHIEEESSPLKTFLHEFNEKWVFIKKEAIY